MCDIVTNDNIATKASNKEKVTQSVKLKRLPKGMLAKIVTKLYPITQC